MIETSRNIHPQKLPANLKLVMPQLDPYRQVTEEHPATSVMTDLRVVTPYQIETTASLDEVNNKMIACGVRLLFVNNLQNQITGLITATDILGEKPLLFVSQNGGSRNDITAQDMMTPLHKLDAIPMKEVAQARVSDVVAALKECRRHHMLVLEDLEDGHHVCGIFSLTQVGRQLGIEINPNRRAEGFAQIKKALG